MENHRLSKFIVVCLSIVMIYGIFVILQNYIGSMIKNGIIATQQSFTFTPTIPTANNLERSSEESEIIKKIKKITACIEKNNLIEYASFAGAIDGDEIIAYIEGELKTIKLLGITSKYTVVGDNINRKARDYLDTLIYHPDIFLLKVNADMDDGKTLNRYVFSEIPVFINYKMIELGYAIVDHSVLNHPCLDIFIEAEKGAKLGYFGYWSKYFDARQTAEAWFTSTAFTDYSLLLKQIAQKTPTPRLIQNCSPSYPTVCIPSPPPDLDCRNIPYRRFKVLFPDPHNFDSDGDGIGCENY